VQEAEIYKNLASVFHDIFDDRSIVLQPGTNASNIEGRDSMNHIGLIAATEAVFGVKFYTNEIESLTDIGKFVCSIRKNFLLLRYRLSTAIRRSSGRGQSDSCVIRIP
jgi:acyl carrier protein